MNIEQYKKIPFTTRKKCEVCDDSQLETCINLPNLPLTEIYVDRKIDQNIGRLDQALHFCKKCGHAQLQNVIDVELQYGDTSTYNFRTSQSLSGKNTVDFFINFLKSVTGPGNLGNVAELGCNDLYLLQSLADDATAMYGVDPILRGHEKELSTDKIQAIGDFFENVKLPDDLDIIICKDVLEHVSRPKEFIEKVVNLGSDSTVFFFQVPIIETILEEGRFDQVFHQHLNYFSIKSILFLLEKVHCSLIDYTINYDHWGTILFAFKKSGQHKIKNKIWDIKKEDIDFHYQAFKAHFKTVMQRMHFFQNEKFYGYGAALMLPVISYYLEDDLSQLSCIIDDDPRKDGLYYLNLPICIKNRKHIPDLKESIVLLTGVSSKIAARKIMSLLLEVSPKHIIYPFPIL